MAIYSDCNAAYRGAKSYALVFDVDSVMQSIFYLLHTRKMEKFFDPTYGTDIEFLLFDLMQPNRIFGAKGTWAALLKQIEEQEPRVKIDIAKSSVEMKPDTHELQMNIWFQIIGVLTEVHQYQEIMHYAQPGSTLASN